MNLPNKLTLSRIIWFRFYAVDNTDSGMDCKQYFWLLPIHSLKT